MVEQLLAQIEQAQKQGDIDKVIDLLHQLLSTQQQYGNIEGEISLLRNLGNAHQVKGQLQQAHNYRAEAFKLAEDTHSNCSLKTKMLVIGDLGRSFFEAHDFEHAKTYTERALEIAINLNDKQSECIYNLNLGGIYGNTGRLPEAIELGEKVLEIAHRLQDHYLQGKQHGNLAGFYLEKAELNKSQEHARQALAHADLSGSLDLKVGSRLIFGESFFRAGVITGNFNYYLTLRSQRFDKKERRK